MQALFIRTALSLMHQNMKLTFILCSSETLSKTLSSSEITHSNRESNVNSDNNNNCNNNNNNTSSSIPNTVYKTVVGANAQQSNKSAGENTNNDISSKNRERKYNEMISYSPHRLVKQFHRYNPVLLNKFQESCHRFKHSNSGKEKYSPIRKDEFDKTLKKIKRFGFNALVWWCALYEREKAATLETDLKSCAQAEEHVKIKPLSKMESENACMLTEKELETVNTAAVTWVQSISKYLSCGQCLVIIGLLCDVWCNSVHVLHWTNQHHRIPDKCVRNNDNENYNKSDNTVGFSGREHVKSSSVSHSSNINVNDESINYDFFNEEEEEVKKECDTFANDKASYVTENLVHNHSGLSTDRNGKSSKAVESNEMSLSAQRSFQSENYNECASTFFASSAETHCAKIKRVNQDNTKNNKTNDKATINGGSKTIDTLDLTDICDINNNCSDNENSNNTELFHQSLCNTIVTLIERALASKELEHQPLPVVVSALYGLHRIQTNNYIQLSPIAKAQLQLHPAFFFTILHHLRQEKPLKELVQSNPSLALEVILTFLLLMNDERKRVLLSSADELVFCNLYEQSMTLLEHKLSEKTNTNILVDIAKQSYMNFESLQNEKLSSCAETKECVHGDKECSEILSERKKNLLQSECRCLQHEELHEHMTSVKSSRLEHSANYQHNKKKIMCTPKRIAPPERRLTMRECLEIMRNIQCSPLLLRLLLTQYLLCELRSPESFTEEEVKYLPKLFNTLFTQPCVPFHIGIGGSGGGGAVVNNNRLAGNVISNNNKFTQNFHHNVNSSNNRSYRLIEFSNSNLPNLIHSCRCLCTNIAYHARINDVVLRAVLLVYCVDVAEYIKHECLHELLHLQLPQKAAIKLFCMCGKYLPWQIQKHVLVCAFPDLANYSVNELKKEKCSQIAKATARKLTTASDCTEIENDFDVKITDCNVTDKKSSDKTNNNNSDNYRVASQNKVFTSSVNKEQERQELIQLTEQVLCILEILCNQLEIRFREPHSNNNHIHSNSSNSNNNVIRENDGVYNDMHRVVERIVQCIDWDAGFVYNKNVMNESAITRLSSYPLTCSNNSKNAELSLEIDVSSRSAALRALHLCIRLKEMFATFPVMTDNHLLNNYVRRVLQDEATGSTVVLTELLKVVSLLAERDHQIELLKRIISYNGVTTSVSVERFLEYIAPMTVRYNVKSDEVLNLLLRQRILKPHKLVTQFTNTPQNSFLACYTHRLFNALNFILINVEITNKLLARNINDVVYVWLDHYSILLQRIMSSAKSGTTQEQEKEMSNNNKEEQASTTLPNTCDGDHKNDSDTCVNVKSFTASSVLQSVNEKNNNNIDNYIEDKKELNTSHKETNVQEYKEQLDNTIKSETMTTVNNYSEESSSKCVHGRDNDSITEIVAATQRLYQCVEYKEMEALLTAVLRLNARFPHRLLRKVDQLVQVKLIMSREKIKQLREQEEEQEELLQSLRKGNNVHNSVANILEENINKTENAYKEWVTHLPLPAHFICCVRYKKFAEMVLPMKYVEWLLQSCDIHIYHILVHSIMQAVRVCARAPVAKRIVEVMHIFTLCLSVLKTRHAMNCSTNNLNESSVYSKLVCHLMKAFINYLHNDTAIAEFYMKAQKYVEHDDTSNDNEESIEITESNVGNVTYRSNDVNDHVADNKSDLTKPNFKAELINADINNINGQTVLYKDKDDDDGGNENIINNDHYTNNDIALENDEMEHDVPEFLEEGRGNNDPAKVKFQTSKCKEVKQDILEVKNEQYEQEEQEKEDKTNVNVDYDKHDVRVDGGDYSNYSTDAEHYNAIEEEQEQEHNCSEDEEEHNQHESYEKLELVESEEYLEGAQKLLEPEEEKSNIARQLPSKKKESTSKYKSYGNSMVNGSLLKVNIAHLHTLWTNIEELLCETSSYLTANDKRDVTLDLLDRLAVFFPRVAELLFASLESEVVLLSEPELIRLARTYPASTPQVVEILSHRDLKQKIDFSSFITLAKVLPMPINEVIIYAFLPTMEFAWCTRLLSALSVRQRDVPNSLLRRILKRLRSVTHEAKDMERLSVIPVIQQFKPTINAAMLAEMQNSKWTCHDRACSVDTNNTSKAKERKENHVENIVKRLSAIHYTVNHLLMIDDVLDIVKLRTFLSVNGSVLERSMQAALCCQVDKMLHNLIEINNVDVRMIHDILVTLNEHNMLFYHTTHYICTCLFDSFRSTSHKVDVSTNKNNNHGNANVEEDIKISHSSKNNNRFNETLCYSNLLVTYVRLAILIADANTKYDVMERMNKQAAVPLAMYSLTQGYTDLAKKIKEDSLHALQWLIAQSPPHNKLSHQLNMLTLLVEHYASDLANCSIKLHNFWSEQNNNCANKINVEINHKCKEKYDKDEDDDEEEKGIIQINESQISVRHFVLQNIVRELCQSLLHHCHLMSPSDVAKLVHNLSKLKVLKEILCTTATNINSIIANSTSSSSYTSYNSGSSNKMNETKQSMNNGEHNKTSFGNVVCAAYDRADAYSRCVFIKAMNTDELVFAEYEEFIMSRICADLPVLSIDHVELVLIAALHMQHQESVESLLDAIGTRLQSALAQCKRSTLIRLLQCHAQHNISDDVLLKQVVETLNEQCTEEVKLNLIQIITFLEACVALQLNVPDRLLTVCFNKIEHSLPGASSQLQARTGQLLIDLEMGFTTNTHNIVRHIFDNKESLRGNAQLRQVVESLCRVYDVFIPTTVRAIKLRRHVHDARVSNYWHRRQCVDNAISIMNNVQSKSTA